MNELLAMLEQFNLILQQQVQSFKEFIVILDQEEQSIASYKFAEIEKSVILKDQHTQFAQSLEEKRVSILKKICYMIAFDSRSQTLSIALFKTVFSAYLQNVNKLLDADVISKLEEIYTKFLEISGEFYSIFENVSARIYRNQLILKKVIRHVHLSINLFQSEANAGMNYDSLGKAQTIFNQQNSISSIRVTV